jgi:hypothetical protein
VRRPICSLNVLSRRRTVSYQSVPNIPVGDIADRAKVGLTTRLIPPIVPATINSRPRS